MMLLSLVHGLRIVQIPVNYLPRVGTSSVTGDIRKMVPLGLWMIELILWYWLRVWLLRVAAHPRPGNAVFRNENRVEPKAPRIA